MDIQRQSHAKRTRRIVYVSIATASSVGATFGISRLRPAAPAVIRQQRGRAK